MSGIFIKHEADYINSFEPYYRETEAVRVFQGGGLESVIFHMQRGITGTFQAVPGENEAEVYYVRTGSVRLIPLDEEPRILNAGDFFSFTRRHSGTLFYVKQDMELLCVSSMHTYLDNMYTTQSVDALLKELQEKDGSSRNHGERVRRLVMQMITHMKQFDGSELEILLQAARMHDVGKIKVPLSILLKTEPLTPEEYEVMKNHPRYSAQITAGLFDGKMSEILLHQHENYDGTGYPDGLKGEEIPYSSRVIAVADAYDAMVVTQPYHEGIPRAQALAELRRCAGTQFDPTCVEALADAIDNPDFMQEDDVILQKTETAVGLVEKEKAKRDFLSNMSHDMRTPMNAIINLTALAREDAKSPENHDRLMDDLEKIDMSGRFLLALVNDILDMSRIDSGKLQFHPDVLRSADLVAYIDSVIGPLCKEKGLRLERDDALFTEPVYVDAVRFEQIFFNILSNSVKYSEPGKTISVHAQNAHTENGKLHVSYVFTDHGIGMSDNFRKRLFTPFERENAGDAHMGTGLGLAITKRIVDQMGGSIEVKSAVGQGTTMTIHLELPIATEEQVEEAALLRRKKKYAAQNYLIEGAPILVVEDHPLNREIVHRLLTKVGAVVQSVENGKLAVEAFEKSEPGHYKAILMDVRMPVMDGITATGKIREMDRPDAKTVPIIAMTAEAFETDRADTFAAGMNAHLAKPIKPEELFRTLAVEISLQK